MGTNFGMLHHETYTKYLSRHATSNVIDTFLYGPCWTRRSHLFAHDNVMPCLKPTKGGRVVLRNDAKKIVKAHINGLYRQLEKAHFLYTDILDELTFTLSLTLS